MNSDTGNVNALIENSRENSELIQSVDKCDMYDYLIAVACGVVGEMVDIFLVGAPGDSVASAIGFLEKKFKVNYDQRHSADVNNLFNMSTKNHHMMSLAHSPDVIGLFFSILNPFTSTATFVANGQLVTINSETFELQGDNLVAKIFFGTYKTDYIWQSVL